MALNLALVPRFGITGSAVATGLSSLVFVVVIGWLGHRHLPFQIGLSRIALYAGGAVAMALLVSRVTVVAPGVDGFRPHLWQLLLRTAVGVATYGAFAVCADPGSWAFLRARLRRLRARKTQPAQQRA